jgi:hypothetical protein
MFEDPNENETPAEQAANPLDRAKEKFDEFRMHAELAAVFEGVRKFEGDLLTDLDAAAARQIQQTIARLEKSKQAEIPVLPETSVPDAAGLLNMPASASLTTNDYHIHRRPGEVMIVRWLAGDEVQTFYDRFQAHFDAALNQFREEERQAQAWKQDAGTIKYLDALDKISVQMADRYLREIIKKHGAYVLSTQSADELDIVYLCDYLMGVEPRQLVGNTAAPPDDGATEADRAWFFKLFALRGNPDGAERMCFFSFLQKTDDAAW